ncbi:L-rhamnose mutarotase [Mucilaginibacter ginsenosidivorans]|uniref:L-rhamnose mutarotase n=1 Tax=Mucilaginibacter ginsenosidivorans TaxID=398053 RepID=A0A5B8UY61_9SPHI|nr:L-rhamnose mutarotase [Mucilaginibacter ginsenosidivorans]QEC63271.1 L-rhamnose mutarotase [Mucilaginibacter ginsenosidivorans]
MKRYCLALDLQDDPLLIAEYEAYHEDVWPEIKASITGSGVTDMEIYRFSNRMFMIMETDDTFTFERKAAMDAANPKVREWEKLMWKFQKPLPNTKPGEKWVLMDRVFKLNN